MKPESSEKGAAEGAQGLRALWAPPLTRRLVVLAAVLGGWLAFAPPAPRDLTLAYSLGERAVGLSGLDVEIARSDDGKVLRRTEFHYAPGAAPLKQEHAVRLAPGDYTLRFHLTPASGAPEELRRSVHVDRSEPVSVELQREMLR